MRAGCASWSRSLRILVVLAASALAVVLVSGTLAAVSGEDAVTSSGDAPADPTPDRDLRPEISEDPEISERSEDARGESEPQGTAGSGETSESPGETEADDDAADDDAADDDAAAGDSAAGEEAAADQVPEWVGERLAAAMVDLLTKEIRDGLQRRKIDSKFSRFRTYAGNRLSATARPSGSELTGYCRLQWYAHLLRNPLKAPVEAEEFTRKLHMSVLDGRDGLAEVMAVASEKLDLGRREPKAYVEVASSDDALEVIERALTEVQLEYCAALAPLTKSEILTLSTKLNPIFTTQNRVGHTLQSRSTGRMLLRLLGKMDRVALHRAAEALVPIADRKLLEHLRSLSTDEAATVEGVTGDVARRIDTPSGAIVIGGPGKTVYQLDKMPGVNVVIDVGGGDVYYEGSASLKRPVLIVIDLAGDDAYEAQTPGVQGSAILGVSMLLDFDGNDVYRAKDMAQGCCLAGAGILVDYAGNDTYVGVRRVQGVAMGGLGICIDRAGNDRYHAALWSQGVGNPWGFGMLDDVAGNDTYYTGGMYLNSYLDDDAPTPGYEGWGQGMGGGLRAVADGGVGVLLEGDGDDVYEYDYLSHGGGYWCGVGFARDFGGNDQRLGATRRAYAGGPRTQRRYQRFGNGFGCHYALGFLFDDKGNDTYNGTIMSLGYAWDCAVGYLCDFGGDDRYSGTEGNGAQMGMGVLFDYDGDDVYLGTKQGRASSGISYHDLPYCGGNFSFVVDYGGTDKYGCGARNNSYLTRYTSGGFLIDRPKQTETNGTNGTADKPIARTASGS